MARHAAIGSSYTRGIRTNDFNILQAELRPLSNYLTIYLGSISGLVDHIEQSQGRSECFLLRVTGDNAESRPDARKRGGLWEGRTITIEQPSLKEVSIQNYSRALSLHRNILVESFPTTAFNCSW